MLQSITRAGEELGYNQSTVSIQIKKLEQELGFTLFDRIGRNVFLTSNGRMLLPYAREAVKTFTTIQNIGKSKELLGGILTIGITDSLFDILMKNPLLEFHREFPMVRLELVVDSENALKQKLLQGSIDAACIISDPMPLSEWNIWAAVEVPVILAANVSHKLARAGELSLSDILGNELILMERTAAYSRHFEKLMAEHNLECEPFLRLASPAAAAEFLLKGSFIAQLPYYTAREYIEKGLLCELKVKDMNITQSVQLAMHKNKVLTPQTEGFLEIMKEALKRFI